MKNNILFSKISSLSGTILFNIILNIWILESTNNDSNKLGFAMSIAAISSLISTVVGGSFSNSINQVRILKIIDLFSCISCISCLFLSHNFYVLMLLSFILNINYSFGAPITKSLINSVVKKSEIISFNTNLSICVEICKSLVPIIATSLYNLHIINLDIAISINSLSYLISFIFLNKIIDNSGKYSRVNKSINYMKTVKMIYSNREFFLLIITGVISNFLLTGYNLFIPIFSKSVLGSSEYYGYLLTGEAVGAIMGSFSAKKWMVDKKIRQERIGILISSVLFVISFLYPSFLMQLLVALTLSFSYTRYNIAFQSFIQINFHREYIGRTFAMYNIFSNISRVLSANIFGVLFSFSLKFGSFLIAGGLFFLNLLWLFYFLINNVKIRRL